MDIKTRILDTATQLLAESRDGDVSMRAVCTAANVAPSTVHRQFGDKTGLLATAAAHAFEQYLDSKRGYPGSGDPVQDIRDGWDTHQAFALQNPGPYRLMFLPGVTAPVRTVAEMHDLLVERLERCAAAGRLAAPVGVAAQMIMSANIGSALSRITRPDVYADSEFSDRVRDAVIDAVTGDAAAMGGAVA